MAIRTASAKWSGDLKEGEGTMALGSGAFEGQYSFGSRFEEGTGTNPEELIGAPHAGCFSMALSGALERAGVAPETIETTARVHLDKDDEGFSITAIALRARVGADGSEDDTRRCAEEAKANCPVS